MKKSIFTSLVLILTFLLVTCAFAQDDMIIRYQDDAPERINPLTGMPVEDADLLSYPPMLVPLTRYPDKYRPSYGHSDAAWAFEMYVEGEESRPMLLYYGKLPKDDGQVGAVTSAIFGLEDIRKQYSGVIITTALSESMKATDIKSYEPWFGVTFDQMYPQLPVSNLKSIMEKWKERSTPADPNNLTYEFSAEAPKVSDGFGKSLFVRYAHTNQVLWQYDEYNGVYLRSQNSISTPETLSADVDQNNNQQIAASNVIILMAPHKAVPDTPPEYGYFDVDINYVESMPAYIFRDGKMYEVTWTTISRNFEQQSGRMRPIRFLDKDGNSFPLKPGQTWVHIVMPGNPLYEVDSPVGSILADGSGIWKLPYIAFKPGSRAQAEAENPELTTFSWEIRN